MYLLFFLATAYASLFETIHVEQREEILLPITGHIPAQMDGTIYRNGFGGFEGYTHLFDGLSYLLSFRFEKSNVWARYRFMDTVYRNESFTHMPPYRTLGETHPKPDGWQWHGLHDNRNGNVVPYGQNLLAINDMAGGVVINKRLETIESITPSLFSVMSSTHPLYDGNTVYNYDINALGYYEIYKVKKGLRTMIVRIPTDSFSYIHSFSMTATYIIFVTYPLEWNVSSILFSPFILPELEWKSIPTRIHLIHRKSHQVRIMTTDPIFSFHHVNAYDEKGMVFLDMIVYKGKTCFDELRLDTLRHGKVFAGGTFRRYTILNTVTWYDPPFPRMEMPYIHPAYLFRKHTYVYAMGIHNNLVRVHLGNNTTREWYRNNHFPTEPVFVAFSEREEDGVLVSVVYDANQNRSYVAVVNAATMTTLAIAHLPVVIPFTCHGFFQAR